MSTNFTPGYYEPRKPYYTNDLIAAAPDLLEALKKAVADIELGALEPADFPWLADAKAAIAKAEGRS